MGILSLSFGRESQVKDKGYVFPLSRFAGNWKGKEIIFWDPLDDFGSFEAAVDEADRLLEEAGFHVMGTPADNKWLSVWPVSQAIGLMQNFHYVFLFALRYACRVQGDEVEDATARHEDELVGALSKTAWHKLERRRELRALSWAESRNSAFSVAVFSFIGEKCIRLHFKFFKHAQQSPFGNDLSLIFDLCRPDSFIQKSIDELSQMLASEDAWKPLTSLFGPFDTWRSDWRLLAADCTKALIGDARSCALIPNVF